MFINRNIYFLLFALQAVVCTADRPCKFTYYRHDAESTIVKRSANCYWTDKDISQCTSNAQSLYNTLGRPAETLYPDCEFEDDVDVKGFYLTEFVAFNSACEKLGGSKTPSSSTIGGNCIVPGPDYLPFRLNMPYTLKGAGSNKFWHNYLGYENGRLIGTNVSTSIEFEPEDRDPAVTTSMLNSTSSVVIFPASSGPGSGILVQDEGQIYVVNAGEQGSVSVLYVQAVAKGVYIFQHDEDKHAKYIQDDQYGTFILGKDKNAAARFEVVAGL
ncbi:hypothetical protein BGZ92_003965 [Podila epicladia]|nr:hypothetical protein BGZ92_003965 [Podila epicladia]